MSQAKLLPVGRRPIPGDLTQAELTCPTIHVCMNWYRRGEMTWEQALLTMALALADQNQSLREQMLEALQWSIKPIQVAGGDMLFRPMPP